MQGTHLVSLRRDSSLFRIENLSRIFTHSSRCEGCTVLTWPDENVLYRQHGGHREQQVLTAERGGFQHGPGEAWVQGEFHHQLPQPGHCASPTAKHTAHTRAHETTRRTIQTHHRCARKTKTLIQVEEHTCRWHQIGRAVLTPRE